MPKKQTPPETYEEQENRDNLAGALRETRKLKRGTPTIDRLRDIVANKSAARVNGVYVDLWSASYAVQVHDALNEANRAKFAALPIRKMVAVAFKLASKAGG